MNIAISGFGITGAASAYLLAKQGHSVTVFEKADELTAKGAGILISPSGQRVLEEIGILQGILSESAVLSGMKAQQLNGKILVELSYESLNQSYHGLGVHRGRLFTRLKQQCIHSGVTLEKGFCVSEALSDSDGIRVISTNGRSSDTFDFLIGADGFHSPLQKQVCTKLRTVDYSHAALWGTAPCRFQPGKLVQFVKGPNILIGLLPIGNGESSFFWGLPAHEYHSLVKHGFEQWRMKVLGLCPDATSIFETIKSFEQLAFGQYRHVAMSNWHRDRILLLGDAAHASSPHLGQGANLGLEDAHCFAEALQHHGNFAIAAARYSQHRRAKLRYYQQLTRLLSPFFQSELALLAFARDIALPLFPKVPFLKKRMLKTLCGEQNSWL